MAEIIKINSDNSSKGLNQAKWALMMLIFIASMWANYTYTAIPTSIRLIAWIVIALIILGLFLVTAQGKRFTVFAKASRNELRKVVWPTRQETIQSTIAVAVMVAVLALFLWGVDSFWMWAITALTS